MRPVFEDWSPQSGFPDGDFCPENVVSGFLWFSGLLGVFGVVSGRWDLKPVLKDRNRESGQPDSDFGPENPVLESF